MNHEPHILVVDDHRDIRDLLARYLGRHGFRVTVAENGVSMMVKIRNQAIDLIVLDIMMPGEDGLTLCRCNRENNGPPVILLTAMAEETDRIVGWRSGPMTIWSNRSTRASYWPASGPYCAAWE